VKVTVSPKCHLDDTFLLPICCLPGYQAGPNCGPPTCFFSVPSELLVERNIAKKSNYRRPSLFAVLPFAVLTILEPKNREKPRKTREKTQI
jgi:hypothetical protein